MLYEESNLKRTYIFGNCGNKLKLLLLKVPNDLKVNLLSVAIKEEKICSVSFLNVFK